MIKLPFKITKKTFSNLLCASSIFTTSLLYSVAAPIPGMPNMSEAEMQKFMGELENTAKEIDNFVSSLPPAEQEEFNRAVQEVEQMINDMSPNELEQFIGGMFGEAGAKQPQPKPIKPTEPEIPIKEIKKETPKLTKKEMNEQEQALDLINAIIKRSESFMVKAQAMPELAGKTKRWAKQGHIRNWQADSDWNNLKTAVNRLIQKLHKMKDVDPKTKQYKFLKDFIEDKALYNNISLLRSNLDQYEPKIEISAFGIEKMSPQVKRAIQHILSSFTESLYILKTPEALNKIIAKYEPRAKELAEEEKKIEEHATAVSKRSPRAKATIVGGTPESEDMFYGGNYGDEYGYNGGYTPGYESAYEPSYVGPSYTPSTPSSRSASTQPKATKAAKGKQPKPKEKAAKEKEIKEKGKKAEAAKTKKQKPVYTKERMAAETYLGDMEKGIARVTTKIDSIGLFKGNIKNNIKKPESEAIITYNTETINEIIQLINKIKTDYINKIQSIAKTPLLKKAYKQRLEKILDKVEIKKPKKTTIRPKVKLEALVKSLDKIENEQNQYPIINQFAYFGNIDENNIPEDFKKFLEITKKSMPLNEEDTAIKDKYENIAKLMKTINPTSLVVLHKSIQELLNTIKDFDKEKKKLK